MRMSALLTRVYVEVSTRGADVGAAALPVWMHGVCFSPCEGRAPPAQDMSRVCLGLCGIVCLTGASSFSRP